MMERFEIINRFVKKYKYKRYLEIGVDEGLAFKKIKIKHKVGVDPNGDTDYRMTSDEFFAQTSENYDIIFIDGLHHSSQADKDIQNALKHLNDGGTIILHDCNPLSEGHQRVPRVQTAWTGDVWKSIARLRNSAPDLEIYVVDTDCGCGVIRRGQQKLYSDPVEYTYEYLDAHRKELLNLISADEFKKRIKQ